MCTEKNEGTGTNIFSQTLASNPTAGAGEEGVRGHANYSNNQN
jgi:hypothetical protein